MNTYSDSDPEVMLARVFGTACDAIAELDDNGLCEDCRDDGDAWDDYDDPEDDLYDDDDYDDDLDDYDEDDEDDDPYDVLAGDMTNDIMGEKP